MTIASIPILKLQKKKKKISALPNFPKTVRDHYPITTANLPLAKLAISTPRLIILPISCGAQVYERTSVTKQWAVPLSGSRIATWSIHPFSMDLAWMDLHERRYRGGALVDEVRVWAGKARDIGNRASSGGSRYSAGNTTSRQADGVGMVC